MGTLEFLYNTGVGRTLLRPLISKPVSDFAGLLLDSKASKLLINPFAKKNSIELSDYQLDDINNFNDFFCRRIRDGLRPVEQDPSALIAPCDGLLSVYRIYDDLTIRVKQSTFTVSELLHDRKLAAHFNGGFCFVYRLCVNHYHRYVYFDSGRKYADRHIDGFFHTVRPVALNKYPVFSQNSRDYSVIDSDSFGRCVQMEVGAMERQLVNRSIPTQQSKIEYVFFIMIQFLSFN